MHGPLVTASWLAAHLLDHDIRIVDTRFVLTNPGAGREAYVAGHIPGAIFADLEHDLASPVREDRRGGRHPMPPITTLEQTLSALGISNSNHVVAYDDPSAGTGFYAAHLWWMLRYLGHDRVSVLDGGLPAWAASGGALETAQPQYSGTFRANPRPEMLVEAHQVENRGPDSVLLDSRASDRYRGENETIDRKPGHIPGAINAPWHEGLDHGYFRPAQAQQTRFEALRSAPELIVYCGSGVSAGANLLALELAGIQGAKLYAGSWSDWISDEARPIVRK